MADKIKEFVNDGGTLIGSKVPNVDPKTSANTTTDKSANMRTQPFMFANYLRFFSESELPHTAKADEMKDNPEGFHTYLESIGESAAFESYFQKAANPKDKLKEIAKEKAISMMETLLQNRHDRQDIFKKTPMTIDEIKNKETLLIDRLTKVADAIKSVMGEEEKKVILSYFTEKIR